MRKLLAAMILAFIFTACVTDGKVGLTALTSFSEEEARENCANGGMKVETGLDESRDGVLDEDEIQDTKYICNGEAGTDGTDGEAGATGDKGDPGVDGTDGVDGEKGDKGDPGVDGEDGVDGEKGDKGDPGDDGTDGICAENNSPVINSINIKGVDYTGTPVLVSTSKDFSVLINATDADSDPLTYSISGGFLDMTDNGSGDYTFSGDTVGVFHFSVIVSDGCQMAVKTFAVEIIAVVYSGSNRNIIYSNYSISGTISLFDAAGTWDDMNLDLHAYNSGMMNEFRFGNNQQNNGNYVEFSIGNKSNEAQNFLYGEEIDESFSFAGRSNYLEFSKYGTDEFGVYCDVGEFKNTTGYAGLRFTDGSDVYYGWIQISVTDYNNSNITGTLIDWAYNATPGESIPAGFTGK